VEDRLEGRRAFRARLRPLLETAGGDSVSEVLRAVASGWRAVLRRDEEIVFVLFTAAQTNLQVWQAWQRLIREGTELLTGYLAAHVDAGELVARAHARRGWACRDLRRDEAAGTRTVAPHPWGDGDADYPAGAPLPAPSTPNKAP
jgi:hypothetical protein